MSLCEQPGCDGDEVGNTKKCAGHIQQLEKAGWAFRANGAMKHKASGTTVTPAGNVTVQANYNPRLMALMTGEIEIEDLDDEELAKGMCRNEDGTFPKRQPEFVPKSMYDRMTRELFKRSDDALREGLVDAVQSMVAMTQDGDVDEKLRVDITKWIFERLRGKVPDVVQVTQEKPYEVVLTHIHRGPRPVTPQAETPDAVVEGSVESEATPIRKARRPSERLAKPKRVR